MKRTYQVIGSYESLIEFELLLALINYCTTNGSSRTISVGVDGRGSANLLIKRSTIDDSSNLVEIDKTSIKVKEEVIFRRFYGDDEKAIQKAVTEESERFDAELKKFQDGHDISMHIGE